MTSKIKLKISYRELLQIQINSEIKYKIILNYENAASDWKQNLFSKDISIKNLK